MDAEEAQKDRFRQKIRDRNLGRVQVQVYPAQAGGTSNVRGFGTADARFAAKMLRHGMAPAAPPSDEPAKEEAPAVSSEPAAAPEKDSGRKKGG